MLPGAYYVFDDLAFVKLHRPQLKPSKETVIQRDGLLSEQSYPHHVFPCSAC